MKAGITAIFVTHDQEEAMSISDLIVVMRDGIIQQIGRPQEVYDDPKNLFVAKFLGTPPINVFNGVVKGEKLYIGNDCVMDTPAVSDREVYVGIRPEGFVIDADGVLECELDRVEVMGRDVSVVAKNDNAHATVRAIVSAESNINIAAATVRFSVKPSKIDIYDKDTEERIAIGGKNG